jgi:hypothetical protein
MKKNDILIQHKGKEKIAVLKVPNKSGKPKKKLG